MMLRVCIFLWVAFVPCSLAAFSQTLDDELRQSVAADLAAQSRLQGDAARGAVVFFQHQMACSKCHSVGGSLPSSLGPDLALPAKDVTDESLVESVLLPSKVIRKGFDSVTAVTNEGQTIVGLLVERTPDTLVVRDAARNGEQVTLKTADLDDIVQNTVSIMPAGQMNQLASRQQFFDLVRYLMDIRDGGAARAKELQPSPSLLTFTVPEYEQHIDHAGLIADWNNDSLQRGEAIYRRVCMNCHGTKDQPGSLPTSLRFASGRFRNGSDPYTMYQTLTRGFGLMAAQTWMVPSQKYDVIHYIRETYLKPHNPAQFVNVDSPYVARLPNGDTRGPEPSLIQPWNAMDYGPSLTHTYEVPGAAHNIACKGIAVRLDPGAGGVSRGRHWMMFDTDTRTEILATGFRAANGVCLNPDGSFVVTDQEGFWNPKNRINWVTLDSGGKPKFYGNMFGYHDVSGWPERRWYDSQYDSSTERIATLTFQNMLQMSQVLCAMVGRSNVGWTFMSVARP